MTKSRVLLHGLIASALAIAPTSSALAGGQHWSHGRAYHGGYHGAYWHGGGGYWRGGVWWRWVRDLTRRRRGRRRWRWKLSGGNILHDRGYLHADHTHSGCRFDCHLAKQFGRGSYGLLGRRHGENGRGSR